jgi:hypothetical protein
VEEEAAAAVPEEAALMLHLLGVGERCVRLDLISSFLDPCPAVLLFFDWCWGGGKGRS